MGSKPADITSHRPLLPHSTALVGAMTIPLNILCQSPIASNSSAADAIRNTVDLARRAEALGYHRFWVAEHHSDRALAGAAPEVMMAHIASVTERIRVGSGGVQIPFYSPFKVAEQFNTLAALFPGRIDLGIGRSGGSEGQAPAALGIRNPPAKGFSAMDELLRWLGPEKATPPLANTFASPPVDEAAQPWILGTSPNSARFAGERGLPYAFGGFLDPRGLQPSLAAYHQHFRANASGDGPRTMLAWNVMVAETHEEARRLARSTEHWFVRTMLRKENPPFEAPEVAEAASYSPMESMMVEAMRQMAFIGTATEVLEGLHMLRSHTHADELTLVTIPYDHAARVRSYELIMEAM